MISSMRIAWSLLGNQLKDLVSRDSLKAILLTSIKPFNVQTEYKRAIIFAGTSTPYKCLVIRNPNNFLLFLRDVSRVPVLPFKFKKSTIGYWEYGRDTLFRRNRQRTHLIETHCQDLRNTF